MNPALAAEGTRRLNHLPSGLKLVSSPSPKGAVEASSLQLRWTWWTLAPLTFAAAVVATPYFLTHGFPAIGFASVSRLRNCLPPAARTLLLDLWWDGRRVLALSGNLSGRSRGPALSHLAQNCFAFADRRCRAQSSRRGDGVGWPARQLAGSAIRSRMGAGCCGGTAHFIISNSVQPLSGPSAN